MNDDKRELRAEMRRVRAAVTHRPDRVAALWSEVVSHCRLAHAQTVMAFVGVGSEPDTTDLIEMLSADGIAVVLPRVDGDNIVAVMHDRDVPLETGPFGIPAPVGPPVDPGTIDLVVVPGLAFTRDGRRLGQGGGFYDRFLPHLGDRCTTIGVCFAEQIVNDLVVEAHDRIVDLVVTDAVQE